MSSSTPDADADRVRPAVQGFAGAGVAAAYDRGRPSYPAEAVAHVVGHGGIGPGRRVLDLAAGTGKLTRLLVPSGADVIAVEPVAEMRERLATITPPVDARDGTAESLPLDDASVDAVTVAQAFHWFDPPKALAEIRRVLRPGEAGAEHTGVPGEAGAEHTGVPGEAANSHLFLLWNMRDRRHGWVSEFGDLLVDGDGERPYDAYHDVDYAEVIAESSDGFGPVEWWEHAWEQPCDEELLVARAASVSVVGMLDEPARTKVLDRVRNLARTHPDLAGKAWFGFPYVTRVWRCRTA